jgi:NAD(P)-dependent dehydrogenase (short-subunit alcohol dehydrogenase family)
MRDKMTGVRLEGSVALVTGGGTGIGAAVARLFAREGAGVVVTGRRTAEIEAVAAEIDGLAVPASVADANDVRRIIDATIERFGRLDVVVNNAATTAGGVDRAAHDLWHALLDTNLVGASNVIRAALPHLEAGGRGSIVNVASISAFLGEPEDRLSADVYSSTKGGLVSLTRALAVSLGARGVRVNAVLPGLIRTPMVEGSFERLAAEKGIDVDEAFRRVGADLPLGRVGRPEEIAAACLFLASKEASFVTGTLLIADGGTSAVNVGMLSYRRMLRG